MNTIRAEIDKSDYIYDDYLNYQIDDYWFDEKMEELYPGRFYGGMVPTLSFAMEIQEESDVVWKRFLPAVNEITKCPILMCPDDNDFSCTIIIAEILNRGDTVMWSKFGVDTTKEYGAEKVGTSVDWLSKINELEFLESEYVKMINDFRRQFILDKKNWKNRLGKL